MGRAYEVRKASIQKTGAARGKIYSMYAREIYEVAKNGGTELESNVALKRLVDKAKKEQVPSDIIKRAIDKVNSGADESYSTVRYELFGPSGSNVIVDCLTDNVNRTVGFVRTAFNKCHKSLGVSNSVSYNYDYLGVISFKTSDSESVFEMLLNEGIELVDFEYEDGEVVITCNPTDIHAVKDVLEKNIPDIEYDLDEVGMYPKEKVVLTGEDKELFLRLYSMLDEIEDVTEIYHNVELD